MSFLGRQWGRVERLIPPLHKRRFARRSWSQEGEDMLLARFFGEQRQGFYVDIGAHHPYRYSNTQLFYERGWRGINIDAMPGSMRAFRRYRRRDINLEMGVGAVAGTSPFFVFNEPLLSTFDEPTARERDKPPFRIERVIEVPVRPLARILDEHLPGGTAIDLLSVDVEGRDEEVLGSNDWERYRPRAVLAEAFGEAAEDVDKLPLATLLGGLGYRFFAKTVNTFLFVDRQPAATSQKALTR
ncbi:MAG: FkbM family methyltransferase [Novosphingobium sp.]